MPIGFELIGKSFDEGLLIGMAYAYEKNMPERKLPVLPEKNLGIQNLAIAEYNNLLTAIDQNSNPKLLELQKLFGGNIPINIQGPFTKLSYQADKSHLATNVAKYYLEKNSAEIGNAIDKNAKGLGNIVSESIKKLFP